MMDDSQTRSSDCNSNPANNETNTDLVGSEFIQDNMDYQWFIDYRGSGLNTHPSVLSSLSASYTRDDLGYYDDLARNLDANLAEVDMESFKTSDIHTLLTALPAMCTDPVQHSEFEYQRERLASISGSVMEKLDIGSSINVHGSSQAEDSASTTDTISICKSSLLFSPVKEMPVLPPGGSYSVDSLDCEDMLITCQTNNKNNYTIAFGGSVHMYSDGSDAQDEESQEKSKESYEVPNSYYDKALNLKNMLNLSMACSDTKIYTTWSNLKHSSISKRISRHPSGNNNTMEHFLQSSSPSGNIIINTSDNNTNLIGATKNRSQSLPDLSRAVTVQRSDPPQLNFSVDSGETSSRSSNRLQSSGSPMSRSMNDEESSDSVGNTLSSAKKLQNMSLVRLFMKQKSTSAEGMSLTLDSESGSTASNESATKDTQIPKQTNDLAIKWVTTDSVTIGNDGYKKISNCSSSMEDLLNTSRSISSLDKDGSSKSKLLSKESCKNAMGVQVNAQVIDTSVQTSLIYPSFNEQNGSSDSGKGSSTTSAKPQFRESLINEKPVYVVYPNYALPDLSFLTGSSVDRVSLKPQIYRASSRRPFSCGDIDALKQKGFGHVKDWESLTFLLPSEYRRVLSDVPEVSRQVKIIGQEVKKPLFCLSPPMRHRKKTLNDAIQNTILSSTSSTATQPSSGYRGSSTILTDSSTNQQNSANSTTGNNPLYLYRYESYSPEASLLGHDKLNRQLQQRMPTLPKRSVSLQQCECPPRPPLPRGILRKNRSAASKRSSMFEPGSVEARVESNKRMSLQEPYYMNNDLNMLKNISTADSEKDIDEAEERQRLDQLKCFDNEDLESSSEDIKQLEDFLKRSGFSTQSSDGDASDIDSDIKLRSCVKRFLALKMNQDISKVMDMVDSQKKTVSFAVNSKQRLIENKTNIIDNKERLNVSEAVESNDSRPIETEEKKKMIWSVNKAVDSLLKYWNGEPVRNHQDYNDKNECSQLCLSLLCPALYAVMSDGLKPHINSPFGPISNSVWEVVEASAAKGPLTRTLNELVQKINAEDFLTEGMLKFHAFIFGLLNLRALDAWFAYLCTRETILKKHYTTSSLFVGALSCASIREIVDAFLNILQPLAFCPFQLDLLYQYRQLHNSFGVPQKEQKRPARPRSCIIYNNKSEDKKSEEEIKRRWSHVPLSTKFHVYERLEDSGEYTDSLEHSPLNKASPKRAINKPSKLLDSKDNKLQKDEEALIEPNEDINFQKLQEKWEKLGRNASSPKEVHPASLQSPSSLTSPTTPTRNPTFGKSKIPRLLTSPVKSPSNLPVPVKPPRASSIPATKKSTTPGQKKSQQPVNESPRRTSRVDQSTTVSSKPHLTRPSSLPYKTYQGTPDKNGVTHRRAASTSLPRPHSIAGPPRHTSNKQPPAKQVRALTSKPRSQNGHLDFNEGDKLKVILEVDDKWLLCERGTRKGLVPRSCVKPLPT